MPLLNTLLALEEAFRYTFVIVKFPAPVHPPVPVKVHVPLIVLLFTIPCCRVSVLPGGVPDVMVNWNVPVIFPLKFPLRTNDPVCDPPEVKQVFDVVKLRLVPVTTVPLLCVRDVVNPKRAGVPSVFVSVAVQLPVTVAELLEFPPPHAASTKPSARTIAIPNCFMATPQFIPLEPLALEEVAPPVSQESLGGLTAFVSVSTWRKFRPERLGISCNHNNNAQRLGWALRIIG